MSDKKVKNIFIEGPIPASLVAEEIQQHSTKHHIGAHSIFLGQVRADEIEGKKVAAIEYTTYQEMALEKMQEIRESIFAEYPLSCLHVFHSLGTVKTGEISLFIFASSKHRKAAIDGCAAIVEKIKKELPVWGKEIFEETGYQWKKNQ